MSVLITLQQSLIALLSQAVNQPNTAPAIDQNLLRWMTDGARRDGVGALSDQYQRMSQAARITPPPTIVNQSADEHARCKGRLQIVRKRPPYKHRVVGCLECHYRSSEVPEEVPEYWRNGQWHYKDAMDDEVGCTRCSRIPCLPENLSSLRLHYEAIHANVI